MPEPGMGANPVNSQPGSAISTGGASVGEATGESNPSANSLPTGAQLATGLTTADMLSVSPTAAEQLGKSLTTGDILAYHASGHSTLSVNTPPINSPPDSLASTTKAEPVNGYFSEVGESWEKDWEEVKTDWKKTSTHWDDQSVFSTLFQQTGNLVDFGVDLIGSVISNDKTKAWANESIAWTKEKIEYVSKSEAYQTASQAIADITGEKIETVNKFLAQNPEIQQSLLEIANAGMEATQQVIDYTKQKAAEHPEAARNLGAVGEILQVFPAGKGVNMAAKGGGRVIASAKQIEIDVKPGTLGSNGGNISIRLNKPHKVLPNDPFPTRTQKSGALDASPTGIRAKIEQGAGPESKRGLRAENKSADHLSAAGYRVEQQPTLTGKLTPEVQTQLGLKPGKNPDYLIEGRVFDNYAPAASTSAKAIHDAISDKVGSGQAHRIVVNLSDSNISPKQLADALKANPVSNLKEIIIVEKGGNISHFTPVPNHKP